MSESLNNLDYWYPLVKGLVPTPETRIIHTDLDLLPLLDGEHVAGFKRFTMELVVAGDEVGWPCFLRTGHGSGKHDWERTCLVPHGFDVLPHVVALLEWSAMVDFFGLPTSTWVVRELLKTEPAFYAFGGRMPITKERRYFAEGGKVLGFHPYWPDDAFTYDGDALTDDPAWTAKLAVLNAMPADEVAELTALSERVSKAVSGAWSIDWLWTTDRGWFLTDMAVASESFCWREHPNAPQGDLGVSQRQAAHDALFEPEDALKTVRVVMPYTEVHPEVTAALDASGYPWEPVDVSSDDSAYYHLLCDLAACGSDFALVEHDIVIDTDTLSGFDACEAEWCVAAYPYLGGWGIGLGCVRFRAGFLTPEAMEQVGQMSDETHPPKFWCRLDAWLQQVLAGRGPCRHGRVLAHLRPADRLQADGVVRPTHEVCRF